MQEQEDDDRRYTVVVNHEEQYSIWFAERELPAGWEAVGKEGTKQECLDHIKEVWTDMRPKSLREEMAQWAANPPPEEPAPPPPPRHPEGKDDLVERLEKAQSVKAGIRPEPNLERFKEQLDRGYVFMRFDETGTELGIRLDPDACDLSGADLDAGKGTVKLVGELTLNYNKVRYHGDLDLATLAGSGRLEFLGEVKPGEG